MGVIQDAVHLEEKAERTYREAARHTQDQGARVFLCLLADAEACHAAVLRDLGQVEDLKGPDLVAAARVWAHGSVDGAGPLSPDVRLLEILRRAMEAEHEAEAFYHHHAERASDVRAAQLFGELAKAEHGHYQILSSLVEYYDRPEEWVESAEFGLRPDY